MKQALVSLPLLIIALTLAACSPSESQISTAIALTQAAQATDTPIPPTETSSPTATLEPSPTLTLTPTASPTPDIRVFDVDPRNLLLETSDLPPDGKYYLPNSNWMTPHRNSEVVSSWGVEQGREYLEATGRVDGWIVAYRRGTSTVNMPEEIYNNVVIYEDSHGPQLVLNEFGICVDPENEFRITDKDVAIGDATVICTMQEMQASGRNRVWYIIEFTRRNVLHVVYGWGWQGEVTPEFVQDVARNLLAKADQAPLAEEVTFRP